RKASTRIQVVDNASGDGTAEMVEAGFPRVVLTRLEANAGFSAANNVGILKSTAPFILVLNPDTELRKGVLDHMLDLMHERSDIGMSGCRLVTADGTFDHAAKRSFPSPVSALAHFAGIRGRNGGALSQYRAPAVDEDAIGDVDAVNG